MAMTGPTFKVLKLVHGGMGLVRDGGASILVRLVAPGDEVRIRLTGGGRRSSRAEVVEVVEASPLRVEPRCELFGRCGGCDFQHIDYAAQPGLKREIVAEVFSRVAKLEVAPAPTSPASAPYNYRSRIKLQVRAGKVGFFAAGSRDFIPTLHCHLASDEINLAIPSLAKLARSLKAKTVELVMHEGGELVALPGRRGAPAHVMREDKGVEWTPDPGRSSPFTQVNPSQNEKLREVVGKLAGASGGRLALELFAGSGNLTEVLLPHFEELIAVDSDPAAKEWFNRGVGKEEEGKAVFVSATVEQYLGTAGADKLSPDLILLDPPRTGAKKAVPAIIALAPPSIIYVSCDPATLARDVKELAGAGYQFDSLHPIDMFPQTAHIEVVAMLKKN